jgi:hypothetical protein
VIGKIANSDGSPAQGTVVTLLPADYNPADGARRQLTSDTTDNGGEYRLRVRDAGLYCLQAVQLSHRTRLLISGINVHGDSTLVEPGVLNAPGSIKLDLPAIVDSTNGYVYIPGTTIFASLKGARGTVILDSVPAGTIPQVVYGVQGDAGVQEPLVTTLAVASGDTAVSAFAGWKYSRRIFLNTTASGANVAGAVVHFPVLIRLSTPGFNFAQAKSGGDDIRFVKSDGSQLACEIERWDATQGAAEVWVKVDTLFGNDSAHYIKMLWGNAYAAAVSNGGAVFDTADGFEGVWHMGQLAVDATKNHFNGAVTDSSPTEAIGVIGDCAQFNGTSNFVKIPGTASGKLDYPEHGVYAVSAWVYVDTLDSAYQKVIEKNNFQYKLQIDCFNSWSFGEYESAVGHELTNSPATAAKAWNYVVGVRSGDKQYLYVNGVCMSSTIIAWPYSGPRDATTDLIIGGATFTNNSWSFFKGRIDESRIESTARSAEWIKLCYMNQCSLDRLVDFK